MSFFKKRTKKEIEESLFFDYEQVRQKKIFYKKYKLKLEEDKPKNFFAHKLNDFYFSNNHFNVLQTSFSSKQVMIKTLSNLDKVGAKNAFSYVIRNSNDDFALCDDGSFKNIDELMKDWSQDFTNKKNSKEVWHLSFGIDEKQNDVNLEILKESVKEVMEKNFFEYKWAMVIHSHQSKPHAHILISKNNRFTKRKFHLNNKDFKDFFTMLRNDFAMALNSRGLEYHNHFKIEKDLQKQLSRLERKEFAFEKNMNVELALMCESISKKIKIKEQKIINLADELKLLYDFKNNELLAELTRLKSLDEKHKKMFKIFKQIKELNLKIKDKQRQIRTLRKESALLKDEYKKIDDERYNFKNNEFNLSIKKKQALLDFLQNNLNASKISLATQKLINELESDIKLHSEQSDINLKDNIKASLIVTSLLGKDNTSYDLIKSYKELNENLHNLRQSKLDKESYKSVEQRLEQNSQVILNFMENRFTNLEQDLQKNVSFVKVKEFEKISLFLDKKNEDLIKSFYASLNTNAPKEAETKAGGGYKKEQDLNLNQNIFKARNLNKSQSKSRIEAK
ncbi:coiled-coil domain-containing protein [Campylobacter sp. MIT 97-5078]|uniref:coiled-coil domain-containing protein n=1 Tax=Campylobacter sp. MIT 97-5078 TaxID=1548153 RepID=UPI0005131B12|nr:hypothetical protein [Campylobacter sp. MIT 97-5078]KGI55496.1 hypothetical protein LR59_11840 [Campylobacter sp. MIT 97-5078]KGI56822.1 hypothetical protein LR59_04900 [Campylobacter sp. MIT 97-5078]TQR25599.1 hypothetical protein DMB91_07290 [Campylobacter sp. MIT 97-5078]